MDMPVKTEKSQEQKTQALEKFRPSQMLRPFEDMERAAKFKDGMLEMTLPKLEKSVRHTVKIEG